MRRSIFDDLFAPATDDFNGDGKIDVADYIIEQDMIDRVWERGEYDPYKDYDPLADLDDDGDFDDD